MTPKVVVQVIPEFQPSWLQGTFWMLLSHLGTVVHSKKSALAGSLPGSLSVAGRACRGTAKCVLPFITNGLRPEGLAQALGRHLGKALPSYCTCCPPALCSFVPVGKGMCEQACDWAVFFSLSRVRTKSSSRRERRRKRQRRQKRGVKISMGTSSCQGFSPVAPAAHSVPNLLGIKVVCSA